MIPMTPFEVLITQLQQYESNAVKISEEPVKRSRGRPKKVIGHQVLKDSIHHELSDTYHPSINLLSDRELHLMKQRYKELINLGKPIRESIEVVSAKTILSYSEAYAICEK